MTGIQTGYAGLHAFHAAVPDLLDGGKEADSRSGPRSSSPILTCTPCGWCAYYERYFVALDESRAYLEKLGISPSRITVSGIPIDPVFSIAKDRRGDAPETGPGHS